MNNLSQKKNEHLSVFNKFFDENQKNDFDKMRVFPNLLPEINLNDVDPSIEIFDQKFEQPFFINAITGGSDKAQKINEDLALLANKYQIPMAVGSQKIALKYPELKKTFAIVRKANPNGFIIANLSADQNQHSVNEAIEMVNANAIQLHLNLPQEIVNPKGDKNFVLLENIENIIHQTKVPVILKSVGFGITIANLKSLSKIGVKYVDISGSGGTNFIKIEDRLNYSTDLSYLDSIGNSTVESLLNAQKIDLKIIASGGIRNPLDIIKSQILGAKMVGISGVFLRILMNKGFDELDTLINNWIIEIPKIMLMFGAKKNKDLLKIPYLLSNDLINFVNFLDRNS